MIKKRGKSETLGIVGFTLGIVSLSMLLFTPFAGILYSLAGIIFCIKQQKKFKTKMAKNGLILNIAGFLLNIIFLIIVMKYFYSVFQQTGGFSAS